MGAAARFAALAVCACHYDGQCKARTLMVITNPGHHDLSSPPPCAGTLRFDVDLSPMASPAFEAGRPGPDAVMLARLVERCLRGSKAIDQEALCVLSGRRVSVACGRVAAGCALHPAGGSRLVCLRWAGVKMAESAGQSLGFLLDPRTCCLHAHRPGPSNPLPQP